MSSCSLKKNMFRSINLTCWWSMWPLRSTILKWLEYEFLKRISGPRAGAVISKILHSFIHLGLGVMSSEKSPRLLDEIAKVRSLVTRTTGYTGCQDGWILTLFFYSSLWTETESRNRSSNQIAENSSFSSEIILKTVIQKKLLMEKNSRLREGGGGEGGVYPCSSPTSVSVSCSSH